MAERGGDRILLIGMMGAGKTTVGRLLAERLGWRYVDSDEQVVAATGRTVREIFEHDGEAAFRREESSALAAALDAPGPAVVSVAGGAVLDPGNRERIAAAGTVVLLQAPVPVLAARSTQQSHRPLLDDDPEASLARLAAERAGIYESLADVVVDATAPPDEIVGRIVDAMGAVA